MRRKDNSVRCNFDPLLSEFLVVVDEIYREWGDELVITSGGEHAARHSYTSLHYAEPARAADVRTWDKASNNRASVPTPPTQCDRLKVAAAQFCEQNDMPVDWLEVILESNHIHIEYQPKRRQA